MSSSRSAASFSQCSAIWSICSRWVAKFIDAASDRHSLACNRYSEAFFIVHCQTRYPRFGPQAPEIMLRERRSPELASRVGARAAGQPRQVPKRHHGQTRLILAAFHSASSACSPSWTLTAMPRSALQLTTWAPRIVQRLAPKASRGGVSRTATGLRLDAISPNPAWS